MRIDAELPRLLWPLCAREIYAFVPDGPCFVFDEPVLPQVALIIEDIRSDRFELQASLKYLRRPHMNQRDRQRAAERVSAMRASLVKRHLQLRRLSCGIRANPRAPPHYWP